MRGDHKGRPFSFSVIMILIYCPSTFKRVIFHKLWITPFSRLYVFIFSMFPVLHPLFFYIKVLEMITYFNFSPDNID